MYQQDKTPDQNAPLLKHFLKVKHPQNNNPLTDFIMSIILSKFSFRLTK